MHRPPWSPAHHEAPPPRRSGVRGGRPRLRATRRSHADARLRGDARGCDVIVRQELAAGGVQWEPKTGSKTNRILPSLNRKTARSRGAIVVFTHLAREGRMTVTIGRRELLAALGGAAAAWPLAARAQREAKTARIGFLGADTQSGIESRVERFRAGLRDLGYVEGDNI